MLLFSKDIIGLNVISGDKKIGKVTDLYFEEKKHYVRYIVVDTGGLLNRKEVLVSPIGFKIIDLKDKTIDLNLTKEMLENSPSIDIHKPISRRMEEEYFAYYQWAPYWRFNMAWDIGPYGYPYQNVPTNEFSKHSVEEEYNPEDSNLRSLQDIITYNVKTFDADFGHMMGFLLQDNSFEIMFWAVDTINWLPSKKVLIPNGIVKSFDWVSKTVSVNCSEEAVKSAPEFSGMDNLTLGLQDQVRAHFLFEEGLTKTA